MSGRREAAPCGWRPEDSERQGLEVLHGGGEKELIACAGKTSQPHALTLSLHEGIESCRLRNPAQHS